MAKKSVSGEATWLANLTPAERASLPPAELRGSAVEPEAERQRRKLNDREREKHRGPKRQRIGKSGTRALKLTNRDRWRDDLASIPGEADVTVERLLMIYRLNEVLDKIDPKRAARSLEQVVKQIEDPALRGRAPAVELRRLELANAAAFPVTHEWQSFLHDNVKEALTVRLKLAPDGPNPRNGAQIVSLIRALFPSTAPDSLSDNDVEEILRTATPGAGGGRKHTKNVRAAVNELILSLGFKLSSPGRPPSRTRR
jgi:hypothetical protein